MTTQPETRATSATAATVDPTATGRLLTVRGLGVSFLSGGHWQPVVEDVSFDVAPGQTLGLVGESGCGKTVSSLAVMRLIPAGRGRITAGSVEFEGQDLLELDAESLRRVRGDRIAMIFQEPMTSLNPAFTVGAQIGLAIRAHRDVSKAAARARAVEVLDRVGIPDAGRRVDDYPHTFSGGMRQRAMIAMALACDPTLLIADEPTTALDVTVQAQILELLRSLKDETGMAMLFVTHDLGVVADICDRVAVMYAGQLVEQAPTEALFARPHHPYTEGLLASMPQRAVPGRSLTVIPGRVPHPGQMPAGCRFRARCRYSVDGCEQAIDLASVGSGALVRCRRHLELALSGIGTAVGSAGPVPSADDRPRAPRPDRGVPLLVVRDLRKDFPVTGGVLRLVRGRVNAVDGIDLTVGVGETVGLVGESGSGKSTVARLVLRLIAPSGGTVAVNGQDLGSLRGRELRRARAGMQMVFQDPYSSLDPHSSIGRSVGEPLEIHRGLRGSERDQRVGQLLEMVGVGPHLAGRLPHEFSGGQRQRIAVARALALEPKLLVCDEPVSALDVSTQSQVINLLADLQERLGLAYLLIAHDLSVVRHLSHRIAVMYLGRIVESGPAEKVYRSPTHPYTEALLSAIPIADPARQRARQRIVLRGEMPSPLDPPTGCRFRTRCAYAMDICKEVDPPAFATASGTTTWCHLHTSGPALAGAPVSSLAPTQGSGRVRS
ncbi:MAG: ABC transporter ATP-binding protein [Actinomycetota bacterium]|nr:ABC transporter ATP-binding protein [Actinomycetota bacterium]